MNEFSSVTTNGSPRPDFSSLSIILFKEMSKITHHDVNNTNSNNDGGGFLSSWLGYFSGRCDDSSSAPNLSQLDRMEK